MDELVGKVAKAICDARAKYTNELLDDASGDVSWASVDENDMIAARAAIAALSTPEFVLPLAEQMLRDADVYDAVLMYAPKWTAIRDVRGLVVAERATLLDSYRAAKGE